MALSTEDGRIIVSNVEDIPAHLINEILSKYEKQKKQKKSVTEHGNHKLKNPQFSEGENAKYLGNSLQISRLPKIDTNNAEQVAERIDTYFMMSGQNNIKPTVSGLALALGINRRTLQMWVNGTYPKPDDVREEVTRAYNILATQMEDWMQNGCINPVAGIFMMKNNMDYEDKTEHVFTAQVEQKKTADELIIGSQMLPGIEEKKD